MREITKKVQERRLKWYGHAMQRRERPKRRWLDNVRDDIRENGLSGEEVYD